MLNWKPALAAGIVALLGGCASAPSSEGDEAASIAASPWATRSAVAGLSDPPAWQHQTFPGKTPNRFRYVRQDGRDAMSAVSSGSASLLRYQVRIEPDQLDRVRFSWKVPELMAAADLASREADDAPVRVILAFDGDRSRFSPRDTLLAELVRTLTGEPMPYATLMYVWCNRREAGTVIRSPRTDRIRKLVVQSGPQQLGRWLDYERDIRADFEAAFGEAPGALIGVAIMTDTDNTKSATRAWYGPVQFGPSMATAMK